MYEGENEELQITIFQHVWGTQMSFLTIRGVPYRHGRDGSTLFWTTGAESDAN
jgi:hypothetical protein